MIIFDLTVMNLEKNKYLYQSIISYSQFVYKIVYKFHKKTVSMAYIQA